MRTEYSIDWPQIVLRMLWGKPRRLKSQFTVSVVTGSRGEILAFKMEIRTTTLICTVPVGVGEAR